MTAAAIGHNSSIGRWVAISVDSRDHPIVGMGQCVKPYDPKRGSYSRYEAWHDLIMEAQWKPYKVNNKGKVITLERGQLMGARSWLAARWNWSEKTVRGFLEKLEDDGMISFENVSEKGQSRGRFASVLTICNYDIYQTARELESMMKGQTRASQGPDEGHIPTKITRIQDRTPYIPPRGDSAHEHSAAHQVAKVAAAVAAAGMLATTPLAAAPVQPAFEMVQDVAATQTERPSRKRLAVPEVYSKSFEHFWELYPRKVGKAAAFRVWDRLSDPQQRKAYLALKQARPALLAEINNPRGNFCPHPSTWLNEGRYDDEVSIPRPAAPVRKKTVEEMTAAELEAHYARGLC